jgi:hypothetical protein
MLATYLYVRGGELEALEWSSVNFEQGYVNIHQSVDADTGEVKSTKTKDVRKGADRADDAAAAQGDARGGERGGGRS